MTASITHGRALRYAKGSARGLLHHVLGHYLRPIRSPQSNGISEAFVKTLKRDYVQVTPLSDAQTVLES
jgi:hypothetical protein